LRICLIGKYPPIQGGVSARTYWTAHGLAARGHEVHVVTNAKESGPPFRMHMRDEDWARCEADYRRGSVTVHWTDPVDRSQAYLPMASPFVSKLAAISGRLHAERPFDVIYSHYLEPYGVAAFLAAQMTGVPHVVRMAGSDAGRLWHHPQLEALYDHLLRSAAAVIAVGAIAERAVERGVDPARIATDGGFVVREDVFSPAGPVLDLAALRRELETEPDLAHLMSGDLAADRPYFGICGKLGETKGSFALLEAMLRLKEAGVEAGLALLSHGSPLVEKAFRARVRRLGLTDRVLQIPFLPPWRVAEFLRGCLAVCCLEQDFSIRLHAPIIPREVLLCGKCLVASTEVIQKFPGYVRLPDGYGCVAIEDVNDIAALSERLAAIARDPMPAATVGARGRAFASELQQGMAFPARLEQLLEHAAARRRTATVIRTARERKHAPAADSEFPLTQLASDALARARASNGASARRAMTLARAHDVKARLDRRIAAGQADLQALAAGAQIEISIAEAQAHETGGASVSDPIFRLHIGRWALAADAIADLVPLRDPHSRVIEFAFDVAEFMQARTARELPAAPTPRPSFLVVFARSNNQPRMPLVVDAATAQILRLSDGTRTAREIVGQLDADPRVPGQDNLKWIEQLFVHGLISLTVPRRREPRAARRQGALAGPKASAARAARNP
jgi:glycosyltransferase involved in cell wall biosynthesis